MPWGFDAPTGTFRDHFLSADVREEAMRDALLAQFAEVESGYGKRKGESVTITRIMQLPLAGRVSELDRLPTGRPAVDTKSLSPSEWGFAIETTEFEENLTYYDMTNRFQRMLRSQMTLTMDKMHAEALATSILLAVPTTAAAVTFETGSVTPAAAALANMSIAHLRMIYDRLRQNQVAPKFRNDRYVGCLSTRSARGIKSDPEYKDWLAPTTSEPFTSGYMRDVEGFALYESNHQDALDDTVGAAGVAGESFFFGEDHSFTAVIEDPDIRVGQPEDFGRFRKVGWVGTLEAGLVWDAAANTRVVHFTGA